MSRFNSLACHPQDKADNASLRSDNTTNSGNSGKASSTATGDTFSISSGETVGNYDLDPKVPRGDSLLEAKMMTLA